MTVDNRDDLAALCKNAYYHARDHGGTMHTAAGDAADAILAAGWVPGELYAAEQARNATLTDTAERLRVRLFMFSIHHLWRELQYGERSATELEPGIAYCADRLGALLATDEEGPA